MICTSPCQPKCQQEAVWLLFGLSGKELGYNCDKHIPKTTAKDYKIEPLYDKENK